MPDSGRPRVVAFLRHVGCPFAEATMAELRRGARAHPEVEWIAVTHSPPARTLRWCAAVGGSEGVLVVEDAPRVVYAAFGLGRTSLRHFLGLRSLATAWVLRRHGVRNRRADGTRWQGAGTFALDARGVVRWLHLPEHAGDLPDVDEAAGALGAEPRALLADRS